MAVDLSLSLHHTATGSWWLPNIEEDVVALDMRKGRVFEQVVVDEAAAWIRPGTTVLDVGSNYGQMAVLFSRMVGDQGTVHAFEADSFVCSILRKNVAENSARNVVVHEGAVWDKDGIDIAFPEPDFGRYKTLGAFGLSINSTSKRRVKSLTIDSLNIETPVSFIKIDVQGSDLRALLGAHRLIEKNRMPVLFEFEQECQNEFFQDYVDAVQTMDYRFSKVVDLRNYLVTSRIN